MYNISNEKFSGVNNIGEHLLMSQIENNIKSFLDWGFLNIGAFVNIPKISNNIYGNSLSLLKPTKDPSYTDGQVWQTMRKDWIWENDIIYSRCNISDISTTTTTTTTCDNTQSISPLLIDGIYINDTFYNLETTGNYAYIVDYINSRIIFDNPIPLTTKVEMQYAFRSIQVYNYDAAQWWKQLQYQTDANTEHFNQINKGDFSILSNNRVQLPAIIIETVSRGLSQPFQLGDKSLIMKQELSLHVIAETMSDRNKIIDILRLQQDKFINMYDTNLVIKNRIQPFFINGTLNPERLNYDEIIANPTYLWRRARLIDIFASDVESFSPFLSESIVKMTVEIIFNIND